MYLAYVGTSNRQSGLFDRLSRHLCAQFVNKRLLSYLNRVIFSSILKV